MDLAQHEGDGHRGLDGIERGSLSWTLDAMRLVLCDTAVFGDEIIKHQWVVWYLARRDPCSWRNGVPCPDARHGCGHA